jgi:SAM-dependent methyltransferase
MLSFADFQTKVKNYTPTVYDAVDNPAVLPRYSHRAHTNSELYYECYKLIDADVRAGSRILDIGAHPGTFLRLCKDVFFPNRKPDLAGTGLILEEDEENFKNKAKKLAGIIDFVSSSLCFKDYFQSTGISFTALDLDYCFHPSLDDCPEGSYDVITCIEVIEHLHTPYKLINTIRKCLNPGGVCVIETNNVHNINGILKLLLTQGSNLDFELIDRYQTEGYTTKRPHLRFYSIKEISCLLQKAGLLIEASYSFDWDIPRAMMRDKSLFAEGKYIIAGKILPALFPRKKSHLIVKARKPL